MTEYRQALDLDANFYRAYSGIGRIYFKQGKPRKALPLLKDALLVYPKDDAALWRLPRTHLLGLGPTQGRSASLGATDPDSTEQR